MANLTKIDQAETHPITRNPNEEGALLIIGIVVMAVLLILSAAVWTTTMVQLKASRQSISRAQVVNIAEAGLDKAVYQLNLSSSFTGESNVTVGAGTYTTTVSNIDSTTRQIVSTGYVPNSTSPTSQVTVKMRVGIDSNVISFRYGVQAGSGGFSLTGGSVINGSVYSNGDIDATTGVHITGSAIAANPAALTSDQTNDTPAISSCTSSTCITFGNANATEDFSQSFKISTDVPLDSVQFYIKKVGNPGNETVRVALDNAGSPSSTTLMTGTLSSSSVTSVFGWASVTMPTTPVLDPSQTYWLVIDGSSNASNYYIIGANSNGYANGSAKIGRYSASSWSNTTPSGLDGYFKVLLGGGYSMIGGNSYNTGVYVGTTSSDVAWGHNVMGATLSGPLYCQTASFTTKSCDTSHSDPSAQTMPLTDNNIQDWKDDAAAGGVIAGDYTVGFAGATVGPKHITGNLTVNGGGTLTMTGTLWVDGTVTITSGGKVQLAASYGSNSGVLVTDGYVSLTGGSNFAGSGTSGSYPFLITTSACPAAPGCAGNDAIYLSGGAGTVALIAQDGNLHISGGSSLKALTAKQVVMDGGATLTYDSGLISENFYSGPGGSWAPIAGTYVIIE
ncbi:MAG TPA: pilus assembly PilX N-terminal domain-containing protein [Patescibacteria group bacterium]|jgi:Tfp pilus assembly protein PilX|nr:pilus assembly PilX N-terminal domain-containing protein [Patescibacteria group bacterium]